MRWHAWIGVPLLAGCAVTPGASPPDIPPPFPLESWTTTAPGARVERDGIAVRLTAGASSAVAWDSTRPATASPWELRTQLWLEEGGQEYVFGVAFGLKETGGAWRGCLLQIGRGPRTRLAMWNGSVAEPLGSWRDVLGVSADAASPNPAAGTLAIMEVSIRVGPGLRAEIDGVLLPLEGTPTDCREGRIGIFAGPGVRVRVPYLTITAR